MGLLYRFRLNPDRIEIDEFAVEGGVFFGPAGFHCQYVLAHYLPAIRELHAVVL